ncbi:fungal-specific transcription factor domain-containing protein [Xylaria acuta]|nr:fungal-specific transcription factor domain-containing protein [Xylaria acuta]
MGTVDYEGDVSPDAADAVMFYGDSSAASFMRQVVETADSPAGAVHHQVAAVSSRDGGQMWQRRGDQQYIKHVFCEEYSLPLRSLTDHLLSCFWGNVYYIYPIFDRPAFERAYRALWEPQNQQSNTPSSLNIGISTSPSNGGHPVLFHCALNTIFAISVSFSDIPAAAKHATTVSFSLKAKRFIGLDLLDLTSLGLVPVMFLVTIFLQSTRYPTRSWHAIGIACRVALGLDLHIDDTRNNRTPFEMELRRRTWQGCVILDM